jgi:hypothetical protein
MPFVKLRRIDKRYQTNRPMVSISRKGFAFNSQLIREAEVTKDMITIDHMWCEILPDVEHRSGPRILFRFHEQEHENCFKLMLGSNKGADKIFRMECGGKTFIDQLRCLKMVAERQDRTERRFVAKQAGNKREWLVGLPPAFEYSVSRGELNKIPTDTRGVYRYVRSKAPEVVYIGSGDIRKRTKDPARVDWDFDLIEYSVVRGTKGDLERLERECQDKHVREHGALPFYLRNRAPSGDD